MVNVVNGVNGVNTGKHEMALVEYASSFVKSEFLFSEIKRLSEKFVYHFLNMFENLSAKFR